MTYALPDTEDESDIQRRRAALAARRRKLADALYNIVPRHHATDFGFVIGLRSGDLATIGDDDRDRFDRLVWKWRRDLTADLRPRLPPFDPIVRELGSAHGA